jgi:hypothetical protein
MPIALEILVDCLGVKAALGIADHIVAIQAVPVDVEDTVPLESTDATKVATVTVAAFVAIDHSW